MANHERRTPLTGWKAIASYLGVTVRTAQAWEKERSLPIHRRDDSRKARVHAHPNELDGWIHDREQVNDRSESSAPRSSRIWLGAMIFVVVALALAAYTGSQLRTNPDIPSTCRVGDGTLTVFSESRQELWQRSFPQISAGPNGDPIRPLCKVQDLDGEGQPEVLFRFVPHPDSSEQQRLICFECDGTFRWKYKYGKQLSKGDRRFDDRFNGYWMVPIQAWRYPLLAVASTHHLYYPTEVALLDSKTGEPVDRYYHPGYLYTAVLTDIDGDSRDELVMGGINNPGTGPGFPAIVALDIPFSGAKRRRRVDADFFGNPGPRERAYMLLARGRIHDATGVPAKIVRLREESKEELTVELDSQFGMVALTVDIRDLHHPRISHVAPTAELRRLYTDLMQTGILKTPFSSADLTQHRSIMTLPTAPDGNLDARAQRLAVSKAGPQPTLTDSGRFDLADKPVFADD